MNGTINQIDQPLLSICIPTYNRANILFENVIELISNIRNNNIPIYISNNCSQDNTDEIVQKLMVQYDNLFYYKQEVNIKDLNFPFILRKSEAMYSWLLGDKNRINYHELNRIMDILKKNEYDAIVVNDENLRVKNIPTQIYTDYKKLLVDLGWHMTLLSSLIFSKKLIENINFERYSNTNFMQTAGIFETIVEKKFKILWINEPIVLKPRTLVNSGWSNEVFSVFFDSWFSSIISLPPKYPLKVKLECIKKHGIESGLFTCKGFLSLRRRNIFNIKKFFIYHKYFSYFTDVPNYILLIICLIPRFIITITRNIIEFLRKIKPHFSNAI